VGSFFKILRFILPYKFIFIVAVLFSILFSLSNGVTIYAIVPLFDTLSDKDRTTLFIVPESERALIAKDGKTLYEHAVATQAGAKLFVNDRLAGKSKLEMLTALAFAVVPLIFLRALFDFIARALFSYAGNRAVLNIRRRLFLHLLQLPYAYFHRSRSGELMSRITKDVMPLTTAVSGEVYNFLAGFLLIITNVTILAFVSWKLIIFILVVGPLIALPINFFSNKVRRYTRKIQEGFADISAHLNESIGGIKVIKSFAMEHFEREQFDEINRAIFLRDLKKRIFQNLNPGIVQVLGSSIAVALFAFGGYQIINGELSSSEFVFFLILVLNLFEPTQMISNATNEMKSAEAASERIFMILDFPTEEYQKGRAGTFEHSIGLRGLSFTYADEQVLHGIDLEIPKGRTVAIVGPSGSGKSTIINLIPGFYYPTAGALEFDGTDNRELTLDWLREKTSMVTQEVFLFNGTVLENITCGAPSTRERVEEAARIAHAHDFIMRLPNGYDTEVGERGVLLSGGERQRITIARAIFDNPEILLFDEATSALDAESERAIQDSLEYLFKTRTSVVISHRLSTIQNADIIYVIERGRIIDRGSHAELLERCPTYRLLFTQG